MMSSRYRLFVILFLCYFSSFAGDEKKTLTSARKALSKGDYIEAKKQYNSLLQNVTNNSEYYFEAGIAYYNSEVDKDKALGYFQAALNNSSKDTISEIFFYIGRSYHFLNEFEKAITYYNLFKAHIDRNSKTASSLIRDVDRVIEMCNNGIALLKTENKKYEVKNLRHGLSRR